MAHLKPLKILKRNVVCKLCAKPNKKKRLQSNCKRLVFCGWAHQGMILGPPDYEK